MKFVINRILGAFILLTLYQCAEKENAYRPALIDRYLQERNQVYINEVMNNCKKELIAKAEAYVDSLISEQISFRLSDSIIFPEKPVKPEFLGPVIVSDTLVAKPVFIDK